MGWFSRVAACQSSGVIGPVPEAAVRGFRQEWHALSSDSELLSAHIGLDHSVVRDISLIAGTGSVATAFKQDPNGDISGIGRAGGWGSLLGD